MVSQRFRRCDHYDITLALLILLLVATGRVFGQAGATGTIQGAITDSMRGRITGRRCHRDQYRNQPVPFQNRHFNSAGDYNAPQLNPGTYIITASAPGFQKAVTKPFVLTVDQQARVPIAMKPGAVTETREITAQAGSNWTPIPLPYRRK